MSYAAPNNLQLRARAELERRTRVQTDAPRVSVWHADRGAYCNRETGRAYTPHHADEAAFVASDGPRRYLCKGGEGSGKSVAGVIKTLERLRRGMHGIMGSPDFEHFKRSLWPEFRRWCPPEALVPAHRRRLSAEWEPARPFTLTFLPPGGGTASLLCGGFDEPMAWEGPNAHFAHFDEARRHKTPGMLKVLDGRVRLKGPQGEPPQLWLTTTPRKHWLYEYFGPWERADMPDPFADFKAGAAVLTLRTADNEAAGNLAAGYTTVRGQSLSASEARVLLEAGWEDVDDVDRFLPSLTLWDNCRADLPPLTRRTPLLLGADAGISSDTFALVAVSRHPANHEHVAVRWARVYVPTGGAALDFDAIQADILAFLSAHNVVELVYDPLHIHQMMTNIRQRGLCKVSPFHQGLDRLIADYSLRQMTVHQRIAWPRDLVGAGDLLVLRQHLDNADAKKDASERLRIVKRADSLKIDAAVTLSMAAHRCLKYPL